MFNVEVNEYATPTLRLLKNIEGLLMEQNTLLKQSFCSVSKLIITCLRGRNLDNIGNISLSKDTSSVPTPNILFLVLEVYILLAIVWILFISSFLFCIWIF